MAKLKHSFRYDRHESFWILLNLMAMSHTPRCLQAMHYSIQSLPPNLPFADQGVLGLPGRTLRRAFRTLSRVSRQLRGRDKEIYLQDCAILTCTIRCRICSPERHGPAHSFRSGSPSATRDATWLFTAVRCASMKIGKGAITRSAQRCPDSTSISSTLNPITRTTPAISTLRQAGCRLLKRCPASTRSCTTNFRERIRGKSSSPSMLLKPRGLLVEVVFS
ncbi:hypothetical protein BKA70DRAFT_1560035 [Coprinopsis sp. MPI-PUGE-AT-0042]|nr:hypothetical protein BKA70DRAFT_1560035 [Coprinopsis sp. MPI-PUGE-AT-0042]